MLSIVRVRLTVALLFLSGTSPLRAAGLESAPLVQHLAADHVVVCWESRLPEASTVEYWTAGSPPRRIAENTPQTNHSVVLSGLLPQRDYHFRIRSRDRNGIEQVTRSHQFDSSCDLTPHSIAEGSPGFTADRHNTLITAAARRIVEESGVDRGCCLVLGCHRGLLALELARRTHLQVIVVEGDAAKVDAVRRALDQAGVYGTGVVVHRGPLSKLPYVSHSANLVVSEQALISGELRCSVAEVCRVLRPCGGAAVELA